MNTFLNMPKPFLSLKKNNRMSFYQYVVIFNLDGLLEPSVEKRLASAEAIEAILRGKSASPQKRPGKTALPYGTKIKRLQKAPDHIQICIPGRINVGSLFMFGFSVFWLAFIAFWTGGAAMGGGFFALFSIPFWIVGIGMFSAAIYNMFGRTALDLTPKWLQVKYTFLGLGFSRRVPTVSIDKLDVSTWYSKNNQSVEGITVYAGAKTLKFGSQLTKPEKDWVIEEVENYVLEHV